MVREASLARSSPGRYAVLRRRGATASTDGGAAHEERHDEEDQKQADDERESPEVAWLSRLHGPFPQASRTGSLPIRR